MALAFRKNCTLVLCPKQGLCKIIFIHSNIPLKHSSPFSITELIHNTSFSLSTIIIGLFKVICYFMSTYLYKVYFYLYVFNLIILYVYVFVAMLVFSSDCQESLISYHHGFPGTQIFCQYFGISTKFRA